MSATSDLSRRSFLGVSALAASTPLTAGSAGSPGGTRREPLRLGLIGCGGRGGGATRNALQTDVDVKLVVMGDAFLDRLETKLEALKGVEAIADRIDVPAERRFVGFDAYQKVLASDVDVVILATPPHFRPAQFEAAVVAGKHVFMEKPVAVDGQGVQQVLHAAQLAKEKNLKVGVGLQRRHHQGYRDTIQRVHDGEIGEILAARAFWNSGSLWHKPRQDSWSDMEWQLRNWLYFTWLSGDHIVEQHIHNLDVINWAKQAHPVKAHGMGGRQVRVQPAFGHIFDHHAVQFEYEDGSVMFSQCRQMPGCAFRVSEHLIGTRGTADFLRRGQQMKVDGKSWRYDGPKQVPFQQEHDDLFAAIRADTPYNEAEYGAQSTLTAIMGRMATYSGKDVTWDQALASERLGPAAYEWGGLAVPAVPTPGA